MKLEIIQAQLDHQYITRISSKKNKTKQATQQRLVARTENKLKLTEMILKRTKVKSL